MGAEDFVKFMVSGKRRDMREIWPHMCRARVHACVHARPHNINAHIRAHVDSRIRSHIHVHSQNHLKFTFRIIRRPILKIKQKPIKIKWNTLNVTLHARMILVISKTHHHNNTKRQNNRNMG